MAQKGRILTKLAEVGRPKPASRPGGAQHDAKRSCIELTKLAETNRVDP